jgi:hypothetical protein
MHRFRVYCGPTIVDQVAQRLSRANVTVQCVGVQHLYVDTEKTADELLDVLGRQGFNWRDIYQLH